MFRPPDKATNADCDPPQQFNRPSTNRQFHDASPPIPREQATYAVSRPTAPDPEAFPVLRALASAGPGSVASWSITDDADDTVEWPGPDGQSITVHLFCGRNRGGR